jgi:O-antigen ligase
LAPISLLAGLAVVVAGTAVLDAPSRRQLADLVIGLGAFLAATAWVGVAFHLQPLGHPDGGLWRAATTITYANAAAAVLGPLALWALARTTTSSTWAARLAVVLLVSGLCATLSRAGIASFAVGLALLIAMLGFWPFWRRSGLALLGGLIVATGLVPGMAASHGPERWWALLGLLIGLGMGLIPRHQDRGTRREMAWPQGRLLIATLVLLGVVGVAALVGLASHNRLWSGRVGVSSPDRSSLASAAWRMWLDHPATGVGPERALFLWTTTDHRLLVDHYAHDEYLQLTVEQGAVGLAGLGVLAMGVGFTVMRGRLRRARLDDPHTDLRALHCGAVAGLACLAVHSGFDFLWHVPPVVMVAAIAVGLAAPLSRAEVQQRQPQEQEET